MLPFPEAGVSTSIIWNCSTWEICLYFFICHYSIIYLFIWILHIYLRLWAMIWHHLTFLLKLSPLWSLGLFQLAPWLWVLFIESTFWHYKDLRLILYIPAPGVSFFSQEPSFLHLRTVLETETWTPDVLAAPGCHCFKVLSVNRTRRYVPLGSFGSGLGHVPIHSANLCLGDWTDFSQSGPSLRQAIDISWFQIQD